MLTVSCLRRVPRLLQDLTGMSAGEFDRLRETLGPAYQAAQNMKQEREDRRRSIGAGRPFALSLEDRLLMGLVYLHLQPSYRLLSQLFGMDRGNIHREIHQRLLPVLATIAPEHLRFAIDSSMRLPGDGLHRAKKPLRSLQQLQELIPDLQDVLENVVGWRDPHPVPGVTPTARPLGMPGIIEFYPDSAPTFVYHRVVNNNLQKSVKHEISLETGGEGIMGISTSHHSSRRKQRSKESMPARQAA